MNTNTNADVDYDVDALLAQMSQELSEIIKKKELEAPVMVGIHSAGEKQYHLLSYSVAFLRHALPENLCPHRRIPRNHEIPLRN